MTKALRVLIDDREIGTIHQLAGGKLRFTYDTAWLDDPNAVPLSLSMPLAAPEHGEDAILRFLWGLLPEAEQTLQRIGQRFDVSPRSAFALIGAIGEDLQGAIQIVPLDKLPELKKRAGVAFLSKEQLAEGFAELARDPSATRFTNDTRRFSLAGAQRKNTLYLVNGKWGEPRGRTPSTHILKPSVVGLAGQASNEMFCLRLAPLLGMPAPKCWVEVFGNIPVIVVQRYDRLRYLGRQLLPLTSRGGEVRRVHQEDMCQALKVHPLNKYQRDGGPSMKAIMALLSGSSEPSTDRERFMRACAYNFVIAGTDAHAKNYSVLLAPGGRFRLAPLYDVASWLPYSDGPKHKLAMSVGGHYLYERIQPRHWEQEAKLCGYDADKVLAIIRDLLARISDATAEALKTSKAEGANTSDLSGLIDLLLIRTKHLTTIYGAERLTDRIQLDMFSQKLC